MKNIQKIFVIALAMAFVASAAAPVAFAANKKFDKNLSYGSKNADVASLQEFLSQEGFLKVAPTGNYLNVTTEAVKAFQKANKIAPANGFFGPITRGVINARTADALLSITSLKGGEKIEVGQKQALKWTSTNYTSGEVAINIIKKVGENPNRYELVRTVNGNLSNDGTATWVPAKSDIGNNIIVEVGCKNSTKACQSGTTASTLAVIDSSRFSNTASAFDAIERADNK